MQVKKLLKTLERLIKKGNSSSVGAGSGGRGKDLKVKISFNNEYSDDDDSFYCPNRSSYNQADRSRATNKLTPINLPAIKEEITEVKLEEEDDDDDEELPSIEACILPQSPEIIEVNRLQLFIQKGSFIYRVLRME